MHEISKLPEETSGSEEGLLCMMLVQTKCQTDTLQKAKDSEMNSGKYSLHITHPEHFHEYNFDVLSEFVNI